MISLNDVSGISRGAMYTLLALPSSCFSDSLALPILALSSRSVPGSMKDRAVVSDSRVRTKRVARSRFKSETAKSSESALDSTT